jgi:DNA primase large subunit
MDPGYVLRYPFLEASREYVKAKGISMEVASSDSFARVHEMARERIAASIDGSATSEGGGEVEERILSYPVARFIVASVGDRNLVKWFAHREAEVSAAYLLDEDADFILSVGNELGLTAEPGSAGTEREIPTVVKGVRPSGDDPLEAERKIYWVQLTGYLPARSGISGPEWDLSNQRLVKGRVGLNRKRYVRLLQELMKRRIEVGLDQEARIPDGNLARIAKEIKARVEARRRTYQPASVGRITITRMPPCMRQILGMSQSGENLPHHARFSLVTFLHTIGMPPEEIFKVFSAAPDFKADIVRYQVEHITGTSSGTEYRVPGCETMKSGGICYMPDQLCEQEWMGSPITYYRVKGRRRTKRAEGSTS